MRKDSNRPHGKRAFDIHKTLPAPHPRVPDGTWPRVRPVGTETPETKRPLWKRALIWLSLSVLSFFIVIGVWDAINISRASAGIFGSGNLFSLISGSEALSQNGRTNVLLVGYSIDDPGHPGADLTDSIMLLSMNNRNDSGYILSIPRDLYVKIPGFGYGKINEVYKDGGIELLKQIVEQDFATPVNYYALINYSAVRDSVNALGGINVEVKSPDPRGLYDPNISPVDGGPLKLANGQQKLDGQTALNFTRARGDAYGSYGFPQADFDRTQHQRQVLTAIKGKLSWTLILNPLKNGQIFQAVGKNVKSDVRLGEARSLLQIFNSIADDKLQSVSLRNINGKNLLASYAPDGQSALIPAAGIENYLQIQTAIDELNQ
ncbi:LCP family protein [Candidatus Saccharibacteria bacterium]|nr:LCP family protein [Candidatus Saccharibacteria bacterium]